MFINLLSNVITIIILPPFLIFIRYINTVMLDGTSQQIVNLLFTALVLLCFLLVRDSYRSIVIEVKNHRPPECDKYLEDKKQSLRTIHKYLLE